MHSKKIILLLTALSVVALKCSSVMAKPGETTAEALPYVYYDGDTQRTIYLRPDLLAEFGDSKAVTKADPSASPLKNQGMAVIYRVSDSGVKTKIRQGTFSRSINGAVVSEVFSSSPGGGALSALPGNIIIQFKDDQTRTQINAFLQARSLPVVRTMQIGVSEFYVVKSTPGIASLETANQLRLLPEVKSAQPDWWREVSRR
ncbi:S8 family serine peptidase [Leptonema illini]|jgi:hypothetical protein|uniref:Lipoprotein n=1 Tax=Leptonema illini DSM 21528 TaxID=929563 RepID=H2CGH4_9LEPT|nr:hypothetical protein [Leptonema illini]EHQ07891.1 hypothetical protein Lepil_3229 [Leptonema illini DSM 21528]